MSERSSSLRDNLQLVGGFVGANLAVAGIACLGSASEVPAWSECDGTAHYADGSTVDRCSYNTAFYQQIASSELQIGETLLAAGGLTMYLSLRKRNT